VMLTRLRNLGIYKTDPDELTAEERSKFSRLNIDPQSITWRRVMDTNLTGANLTGACLTHANLARAYLTYANLASANLTGAHRL